MTSMYQYTLIMWNLLAIISGTILILAKDLTGTIPITTNIPRWSLVKKLSFICGEEKILFFLVAVIGEVLFQFTIMEVAL